MKHWMTRLATLGAAVAVIGLWMPISSANAAAGGARFGGVHFVKFNGTSTGQAGYFQLTPPATSSVKDKFTVPTVTGCTSTEAAVGFGTFIFTGSGSTATVSGAAVLLGCVSSTPVYEGVTIVNGVETPTSFTPAPGDVIAAKTKVTATAVAVKLKDVTQAMTATGSSTSGATPAAILAGVDTLVGTGGTLPVPNFGTVHLTAGKIDGVTVGASGATAFDLNSTGSQIQIKTSALTGGNAWSEKFIHA